MEQSKELPLLIDYIAFAQNPDFIKLIGKGKETPQYLFRASNALIAFV